MNAGEEAESTGVWLRKVLKKKPGVRWRKVLKKKPGVRWREVLKTKPGVRWREVQKKPGGSTSCNELSYFNSQTTHYDISSVGYANCDRI